MDCVWVMVFLGMSVIIGEPRTVSAINCYSCQYLRTEDTYSCVNEPWKYPWTPVVHCGANVTGCQIEYQTEVASGKIYYVRRACGNPESSGCQDSGPLTICHTSCSGELCNHNNIEDIATPPTPGPSTTPYTGTTARFTGSTTTGRTTVSAINACYSCQYLRTEDTYSCVNEPWNYPWAPEVKCGDGVTNCQIEYQIEIVTGKIFYVRRDCGVPASIGCQDSGPLTYCTMTCTGQLCNLDNIESLVTASTPGPSLSTTPYTGTVSTTVKASTISCYSCQYLRTEDTYSCVNEPWNYPWGPVVNCGEGVTECQIEYQILVDTGDIFYVRRTCGLPETSGCQDFGPVSICHTSCTGELCNDDNIETIVTPPTPGPRVSTTTDTLLKKSTEPDISCYICTWVNGVPDRSCLDDPKSVPYLPCADGGVCATYSSYSKAVGDFSVVWRSCLQNEDQKDECIDAENWYTCWKYCSDDLCNTASVAPPPFKKRTHGNA